MVEFLYHVDENDNVLGKVERKEAHSKGVLHRAGIVLVFNSKKEIFLTKRSLEKDTCPGYIDNACSFQVKYGESYEKAAERELYEETRIKRKLEYVGDYRVREPLDNMIVRTYKTTYDGEIILDPKEVSKGEWHSFEETEKIIIQEKVTPWLQGAWKLYKKSIGK